MENLKLAILIILILTLGSFIFLLASPKSFYSLRDLLNPNKIIFKTKNEFKIENVEIYWNSEMGKPIKIFSSGKELDVTYKEYGPNNFSVLYDKDTLVTFSYFKTNNWHGHQHFIQLTQDTISVKIKGPDEDRFTLKKLYKIEI